MNRFEAMVQDFTTKLQQAQKAEAQTRYNSVRSERLAQANKELLESYEAETAKVKTKYEAAVSSLKAEEEQELAKLKADYDTKRAGNEANVKAQVEAEVTDDYEGLGKVIAEFLASRK